MDMYAYITLFFILHLTIYSYIAHNYGFYSYPVSMYGYVIDDWHKNLTQLKEKLLYRN